MIHFEGIIDMLKVIYKLIEVSEEEQLPMGMNVLSIGNKKCSASYKTNKSTNKYAHADSKLSRWTFSKYQIKCLIWVLSDAVRQRIEMMKTSL